MDGAKIQAIKCTQPKSESKNRADFRQKRHERQQKSVLQHYTQPNSNSGRSPWIFITIPPYARFGNSNLKFVLYLFIKYRFIAYIQLNRVALIWNSAHNRVRSIWIVQKSVSSIALHRERSNATSKKYDGQVKTFGETFSMVCESSTKFIEVVDSQH